MKTKSNKKAIILLIFTLLLGCSFVLNYLNKNFDKSNDIFDSNDDFNASIVEKGIDLKLLNTIENDDGTVLKTFNFTILPDNATDQSVTAEAKYLNGEDCSTVLSVSVDNNSKIISVLNKADFNQKIIITITANADRTKYAIVNVDYQKKLLNINGIKNISDYYKNQMIDYSYLNMIQPDYSLYTIDKNYSFGVKNVSVIYEDTIFNGTSPIVNSIGITAANLLKEKIEKGEGLFTSNELYNLSDTSEWHSILQKNYGWTKESGDDEPGFAFFLNATYYCVEDPSISFSYEEKNIFVTWTHYDGTGYVEISDLELNIDSIIF